MSELRTDLARELEELDPQVLGRLATAALARSSLTRAEDVRSLAETLGDATWLQDRISALAPPARLGLRLLTRARNGLAGPDLDASVRLAFDDATVTAADELVSQGLAFARTERPDWGRRPEWRLHLLGSLRRRVSHLAVAEPDERHPTPSAAEELYAEASPVFALGATLAVAASLRPRAARHRSLHKSDEKLVLPLLAPVHGDDASALEAFETALQHGLLQVVDGRFDVDRTTLASWVDPGRELLLRAIDRRAHDVAFAAGLGLLLESDWVARATLVETMCAACIRRPSLSFSQALPVSQGLARLRKLPGLLTNPSGAFRLAAAARRALDGGSWGEAPPVRELVVQPNLDVVAPLGTPVPVLVRLASFARVKAVDRVVLFAIDEATVRRAAAEGADAASLLSVLEENGRHGVASTVLRALTDWTRTRDRARVLVGTVVLTELPLEEVRRHAGAGTAVEQISPGVFLLPIEAATGVAAALRRAGAACELKSALVEEDHYRDVTRAPDASSIREHLVRELSFARRTE